MTTSEIRRRNEALPASSDRNGVEGYESAPSSDLDAEDTDQLREHGSARIFLDDSVISEVTKSAMRPTSNRLRRKQSIATEILARLTSPGKPPQELEPSQSPKPFPDAKLTCDLVCDLVVGGLLWLSNILTFMMPMLTLPLAVVLSSLVLSWMLGYIYGVIQSSVCALPGISYLSICPQHSQPPSEPSRLFSEGLDYGAKLAQMQKIGANSAELPYLLHISEGSVRSMIVQLASVDLPSEEKLMPLLTEYRQLADNAINGLQETLAQINQAVDETIHISGWASDELQAIEQHQSSIFAPVKDWLFGGRATEAEVRKAFIGLTDEVQLKVGNVLFNMLRQSDTLRQLQTVLDNIAVTVLGDKAKLERAKLREASYWKWIMRSYRSQMSDFDDKMAVCATFYLHVDQAQEVVSITKFRLEQIRGQVSGFRDGLQEAPLHLRSGSKDTLQLYIRMLNARVQTLEESKRASTLLKEEKIRKLDASLKV